MSVAESAYDLVGLYFFLRAYKPLEEQLRAWYEIAWTGSFIDLSPDRQIVPILDVESEQNRALSVADLHTVLAALEGLSLDFGCVPMVYVNERDWCRLGKPEELLDFPWWWAQYSSPRRSPAAADVRLWQHRVAVWTHAEEKPGFHPVAGAIDQSRILAQLPTIG